MKVGVTLVLSPGTHLLPSLTQPLVLGTCVRTETHLVTETGA